MSPALKLVSSIPDEDLDEDMMEVEQNPVSGGSGGGGSQDDLLRRVLSLEEGHKVIIDKLERISDNINESRLENERRFGAIDGRLSGIEKSLEAKALSADIKEINGKISNIPTTWQIIGIVAAMLCGIFGVSVTISKLNELPKPASSPASSSSNPPSPARSP